MMTPVFGFRGPGAQMPMAEIWFCESSEKRPRIAVETAASPFDGGPEFVTGVLLRATISPWTFTRPAATLVPPMSTPTTTRDWLFICCRESYCTGDVATPTFLSAP